MERVLKVTYYFTPDIIYFKDTQPPPPPPPGYWIMAPYNASASEGLQDRTGIRRDTEHTQRK